ncbi:MAG: exodeoxyribonuclease V subunit alpha, partial [Candidatus Binataceae bacterium]
RSFEAEKGSASTSTFERRLRDIESAVPELNLSIDSVKLATELAALEPDLNDDQRIALIVLVLVSLAALQEGSTRFPVSGPQAREPMRRMLGPLYKDAEAETMVAAIKKLLSSGAAPSVIGRNPEDYKPLLYLPPFIYHQRIHAAENALATKLAQLVSPKQPVPTDEGRVGKALADVINRPSAIDGKAMVLSEEQRKAVAAALRSRLTVISGGPGTGKTSIVLAILRAMVRIGVRPGEVALAAPTGKAAYRMGECIREGLGQVKDRDANDNALMAAYPEPSTIHRLLGFSPSLGRFRHHHNNPLAASAIVVDEGSMLDLSLMERLVDAIGPDTSLIVLGDADQLPSVAAGAVFHDLLQATAGHPSPGLCFRLTQNYRVNTAGAAGGAILSVASSINEGVADILKAKNSDGKPIVTKRATADELEFGGVEFLADASGGAAAFLDRWYKERVLGSDEIRELATRVYNLSDNGFEQEECNRLSRLFGHLARSRILCVTSVLETGTDRINARLHRRTGDDTGSTTAQFRIGEPVLVLRNDYERMLFNGDQGIVLRVRGPKTGLMPMAVFPRGENFVAFRVDALREDLDLCYAMTVHKAQGSEFDSVAIVLPTKDVPILTREVLYTAVSRARRSVVILGSEEILRLGTSRKIERHSGLHEQLQRLILA